MTVKIRTRKKFLAVAKACMDIFRHTPGFKGRAFVSSAFSTLIYIHDTPPVGRRVGRPGNRNIFRWHTSALSGGRPLPLPVGICNQKDHTKWKAYPSVSKIHKLVFQLHSMQFKQTRVYTSPTNKQTNHSNCSISVIWCYKTVCHNSLLHWLTISQKTWHRRQRQCNTHTHLTACPANKLYHAHFLCTVHFLVLIRWCSI